MVYHVYIMASASGVLYIGVTNNLERRVAEHKSKRHASYTANYQITKLVYFEAFGNVKDAISRETQYKKWRRNKKVALIENQNAHWRDLSQDFHPSISL
jgi:putative endonuclease